ncbi:MAG TPA: MotA/TolQ/ExbB proton channel family protein [Flavobacteriales bacterium]|jgi:biopolymer transport protein ExbB|nr:MotA/TolQ/ExbB proton channel family protein [Flavobacteriales bacterium]
MQFPLFAQVQETVQAAQQAVQQAVPVVTNTPTQDQLTVWELVSKGGWWIMGPLALMSLVTIYIVIERAMALSKALKEDKDFINKIRDYIHEGKTDSARNLCAQSSSPSARMVEKGIQRIGKPTKEIESAMEMAGRVELSRLERGISLLSLFAKLAPMFGFIGTIIGVIKIFYDISLTDNISISVISGGLYQKMVTSSAGLVVGIIAFTGYFFLHNLVERVINKMERTSMAFIDVLSEPTK